MSSQSSGIVCPQCHKQVADFTAYPYLTINMCNHCGLSWLDAGELGLYLKKSSDLPPSARPTSITPTRLSCPSCKKTSLIPWIAGTVEFKRCRECLGILISLKQAQALKKLFPKERYRKIIGSRLKRVLPKRIFDIPLADLLGLPICLALASLFAYSHAFLLLTWLISVFFHELGHALAAWLSGFFAVPTPFAFTFVSGERHGLVIALSLALWSIFLIIAHILKSRILTVFFLLLLNLQIAFSFYLSADEAREWIVASGFAFEMIFGALLLGAFHYRLPSRLRWDFWRFPALVIGGILYSQSLMLWFKVKEGRSQIPWGSAVGRQSDGDLSRLRDLWSWSELTIVDFYYKIAVFCLLWILMHYLIALPHTVRSLKQRYSKPDF